MEGMANMTTSSKTFWRDRNVLITGCTGLVGSHLTQLLHHERANIVGLVRDSVPPPTLLSADLLDQITVVKGTLEDHPLMLRIVNEYEIETVFHLAAQTIVSTANRSPLSTFESNIRGTWQLLEACRLTKTVKAVVVASSDKAYGSQDKLPYDETVPLEGRHPYDVSKSCADLISLAYHKSFDLPVCVTRCGNFYGPGDLNWNRIVPGTIRSALRNERPVIRSDGSYIRDYFYVRDGALAYQFLAEAMLQKGISGGAFNFSNEIQMTVLELVRKILGMMGKTDMEPIILNQAGNEIKNQSLSAAKARSLLGWSPRYKMDDALRETISWYQQLLG